MVSSPLLLFADVLTFCLQLLKVHLSDRFFSNNVPERLVPSEIVCKTPAPGGCRGGGPVPDAHTVPCACSSFSSKSS